MWDNHPLLDDWSYLSTVDKTMLTSYTTVVKMLDDWISPDLLFTFLVVTIQSNGAKTIHHSP
jgi:hypothetical protein